MAVIRTTIDIPVSAARAWALIEEVGAPHKAFAPVLSASRLDGSDTREATFANGLVVRERIFSVDAELRRVAYGLVGSDFAHHNASMEIVPLTETSCRFVWTTDVSPDEAAARLRPLMEAGTQAFAANAVR